MLRSRSRNSVWIFFKLSSTYLIIYQFWGMELLVIYVMAISSKKQPTWLFFTLSIYSVYILGSITCSV